MKIQDITNGVSTKKSREKFTKLHQPSQTVRIQVQKVVIMHLLQRVTLKLRQYLPEPKLYNHTYISMF
jgi:hypothetical protein